MTFALFNLADWVWEWVGAPACLILLGYTIRWIVDATTDNDPASQDELWGENLSRNTAEVDRAWRTALFRMEVAVQRHSDACERIIRRNQKRSQP